MKKSMTLAERWLWLGVTALALAGVFAIILVIARTPQLAALTLFQQLFSVALVVHVDLSVLLWFTAMFGMGTALLTERQGGAWPHWPNAAFYAIAAATFLIAFSPLDPGWEVIKSNYIPVLENHLFLLGLGLLSAGLTVLVLPILVRGLSAPMHFHQIGPVGQGILAAAGTFGLALIAFYLSARALPAGLSHDLLYEKLFWAGGHILQFAFSLLMMAAWLALLERLGLVLPRPRFILLTYAIAALGGLASFLGFALYPAETAEFTAFQTRIMVEWGGIGPGLLGLAILYRLFHPVEGLRLGRNAYAACLVMSLIVFGAGGALGAMISGQNVTIPAHYHGMIVGVTLALMGFAYGMLPRFGYASVAASRLAFWQPIVYGAGQLMHIGGLGYSGGYGVLRKTPGAIEAIGLNVKIALGIMGVGGMLAILGGILFVIVMVRARVSFSSASRQQPLLKNDLP